MQYNLTGCVRIEVTFSDKLSISTFRTWLSQSEIYPYQLTPATMFKASDLYSVSDAEKVQSYLESIE